jgi:glycosyltransferase involved in cell wall biosynthesis
VVSEPKDSLRGHNSDPNHGFIGDICTLGQNTNQLESIRSSDENPGIVTLGGQEPPALRRLYAGTDALVLPSLKTRDFCEPWGLVANEAFNQGVPVIASDAVGAAAGGLIDHEQTGLIVPAGDHQALAKAMRRLHEDPELRKELGENARSKVDSYNYSAWSEGVTEALRAVRVSLHS